MFLTHVVRKYLNKGKHTTEHHCDVSCEQTVTDAVCNEFAASQPCSAL